MVCEGDGWRVKVKRLHMKVMKRCVKVMMRWFVKVKGWCVGDGNRIEYNILFIHM